MYLHYIHTYIGVRDFRPVGTCPLFELVFSIKYAKPYPDACSRKSSRFFVCYPGEGTSKIKLYSCLSSLTIRPLHNCMDFRYILIRIFSMGFVYMQIHVTEYA